MRIIRRPYQIRKWFLATCQCVNTVRRSIADQRGVRPEAVDLSYTVYKEHYPPSSADKTPVVVAHGLLGSKNNWHSLSKAINKMTERKVLAIDQRCHGESPHVPTINYDILGEDILHFLEQHELSKAVLVGHSMGGRAVIKAALKRPDVVDRLIVVDISPLSTPLRNPTVSYLDALQNVPLSSNVSLSAARKQADQHLASVIQDAGMRQFLLTNLVKDPNGRVQWRCDLPTLVVEAPKTLMFPDLISGCYDGPTLFIGGGNSPYIPKEEHATIRQHFPQAKFEYIPGGSHFVHTEKPKEFVELVTEFLKN